MRVQEIVEPRPRIQTSSIASRSPDFFAEPVARQVTIGVSLPNAARRVLPSFPARSSVRSERGRPVEDPPMRT